MVEKHDIEICFASELAWIKKTELRGKVVAVWKEAADRGKWHKLEDAPFTLLIDNSGRLIDHTKRVTHLAKAVADQRKETLNIDYLIAGALLHDVGKLLEYVKKDGKYVKGPFGEKFRHPVSGSLLAKEFGLPDEVVFIIYAHSHEGDKLKRSPEAVVVNHCDFIDFEIKKSLV
ncbi:MAG: HD domain-containing protein [Candidatus Thermoplasmatota archaeon]|nr:HD domain-containing protein [Candidatus Thermoplasmatota archaeon]